MNASINQKHLQTASTMTSVFRSGNSQAVRIPKEFQFSEDRVAIFRRGAEIVLRPQTMTAADALAGLPAMPTKDALALDDAMAARNDSLPLEERDWGAPARPPKARGDHPPGQARRKAKAAIA